MEQASQTPASRASRDGAFRLLALLTAAVFIGETGIRLILNNFDIGMTSVTHVFGAVLLTLLLFPILYIAVFKDILGRNKELKASTSQLRAAHDWLEQRIEERTQEMQCANRTLEQTVVRLSHRQREMAVLGEMGHLFQACRTVDEACVVAKDQLSRLFPDLAGALYLMSPNCSTLDRVTQWGGFEGLTDDFEPDDCWALRCGRPHEVGGAHRAVGCRHMDTGRASWHLCLPMAAQGEALGLLCLQSQNVPTDELEENAPASEDRAKFYATVADGVALAFANLRLRETLQHQALRDPLTGLFNRRYLLETLERELHRAGRSEQPLGIVILDIDHFKTFNDTYGHGAGDALLEAVGTILRTRTRAGDIACRYGGEEFALVLPGACEEVTLRRVEALRNEIRSLAIHYRGRPLGQVTISAGVSVFPRHGADRDALIHAADEALYAAKQRGRNRAMLASLPQRVTAASPVELVRLDGGVVADHQELRQQTSGPQPGTT